MMTLLKPGLHLRCLRTGSTDPQM